LSARYSVRAATIEDEQQIRALLGSAYPALMKDGYEDAVLARVLPFMIRANSMLLRSGTCGI
jgi:hypothetical protein